ncbi:iron-sulfur cluster insertion protein [Desulfobaculum xiamenense]|uniref:Iron-sulfur cluster insertion protein n=1 Tax=Desulfobaculum xiamenense TaxID=995050 RepID=A0A846QRL3_9BACT|nr:ErpA-related iron-sulfur cluster insertion protein [Desulfobaculum xiamenense]NJB69152.1 iron-sulfur cluster insertion protein [Desulfobaculum xiamenense]
MFEVTIPEEMLEKLRSMLEDEDEGTCVRLREYKHGSGCSSKIILGLGMEERDEDEDVSVEVQGVPFIADKDFLVKYGTTFTLEFNENGEVVMHAVEA